MNKFSLPSLQTLRTFESCYRLGSFTRAAAELNVSQGAVSQRIKTLEVRLGFAVFLREGRSIVPTPSGRALLQVVNESLTRINEVIYAERSRQCEDELIVSCLPGFAIRWLFPRLINFEQVMPDVRLSVNAISNPVEFSLHHAHLAIVYTQDSPDSGLFTEAIFPVCSPAFAQAHGFQGNTDDVSQFINKLPELTLLYDVSSAMHTYSDIWAYWAKSRGVDLTKSHVQKYRQSNITLQLAELGHGVAMGRTSLVMDAIKKGQLIQLQPARVLNPCRYHLQTYPGLSRHRGVEIFSEQLRLMTEEIDAFARNYLY
ncbi:LysR family transcriptional regulator [Endozoicomonas sp. ONNA2]|uniref:LysR family transcriptional regulator n=1 Tax=Endozoicomonas sp. ONNA2 TaxID=2828741 RepID=UPI0021495E08|nr:LysR family transcriptional regulator [Endozoicomonas sp. ONNA2]